MQEVRRDLTAPKATILDTEITDVLFWGYWLIARTEFQYGES
jgi:hypothetical protein